GRAGQPPHRVAVLAVVDDLGAMRLGPAHRAAQCADELVLVVVDPLAGERGATAVGAAVAVACEGAQALAEQLALEIGTGSGHGAHIRQANVRSFRLFTIAQCVFSPTTVWSNLRGTLGSARTATAPAGRWRESGDGVTDVGHAGRNRIVPVRGVRLRGDAGCHRHAPRLPRLRWLGVHARTALRPG